MANRLVVRIGLFSLASALVAANQCVNADPLYGLTTEVNLNVLANPNTASITGSFPAPSFTQLTSFDLGTLSRSASGGDPFPPSTAHAEATGSIDGATLRVSGLASATPTVICDAGECNFASAEVGVILQWKDTLSLSGPTGVEAEILVTHHFSGTSSGISDAFSEITLSSFATGPSLDHINSTPGAFNIDHSLIFTIPGGGSTTIDLLAFLNMDQVLAGNCFAVGTGGCAPGNALSTLDALNTSSVFLELLTPGFTLTAASGLSYAAPAGAPEPPVTALLGLGLAGLGFSRRRHKSD
jgi:hypothetical protein